MFATTMMHPIVPSDKTALAVIEGNILKSIAIIGSRVVVDLNLDWPSINAQAVKTKRTHHLDKRTHEKPRETNTNECFLQRNAARPTQTP
jgi:hypothetical protein